MVEERKFCLYSKLAKETAFKRLANNLPYSPEKDLLLPEVLGHALPERLLHLALQMHFHFAVACCVAEVTNSAKELKRLAEVLKLCHRNLLCFISLFNLSVADPKLTKLLNGESKRTT